MFEVTQVVKKKITKDEYSAVLMVCNYIFNKKMWNNTSHHNNRKHAQDELQQELYLWLLQEYNLVERYREEEHGKHKLTRAMINYAYKHLNTEKQNTQPWLYDYPKETTIAYINKIISNNDTGSRTYYKIQNDTMSEAMIYHFTTGTTALQTARLLGLQERTLYRHIKNIHLSAAEELEFNNNYNNGYYNGVRYDQEGEKYLVA